MIFLNRDLTPYLQGNVRIFASELRSDFGDTSGSLSVLPGDRSDTNSLLPSCNRVVLANCRRGSAEKRFLIYLYYVSHGNHDNDPVSTAGS